MTEVTQSSHYIKEPRQRPTVRAGAVVFGRGGLLLVRQRRLDTDWWLLPGGGVRFGETLADALTRELFEELRLEIAVGRPLALVEAISPDMAAYPKHVVHVILEATPRDETATPILGGDAAVLEAAFVSRVELSSLRVTPPIADFLDVCYDRPPDEMAYLGRRW